ncbi:hypothetical protein [Paenibacillus brevis]|uniref:DUF2642 domain-containing protein n=1 Tax=Paenibacillus brevis TaxID=2841508 RepID=A0ABS6FMX8_9BACL|nr:hypothetical protein [Paenibacillus brevis]MBU5671528.1 hypothetical protein [Paenibacillus brevis]
MNAMLSGKYRSARRSIRILSARIELLEHRVEHLEETVQSHVLPLPLTRERLHSLVGTSLTVQVFDQKIQGTLLSVQPDFLELMDQEGRRVIIPAERITAIDLE